MKDPSKLTGKGEIYNLVIDMFESHRIRFLDIEEGKHVATVSFYTLLNIYYITDI